MLFNSLTFLAFLVVVQGAFRLVQGWGLRRVLLLCASYIFYAAWSPPYVLLLLASTVIDWSLARAIDRSQIQRRRNGLLLLSVVVNLGFLGYFKYGDFLLQNFAAIVQSLGYAYPVAPLGVVLPVGISFYTFASLSYTVDVYRRQIKADASFTEYALFVGFFPHLVAGPIVRAERLLPQIRNPRLPTADEFAWGVCLLLFGLFGKVVLADQLFAPIVNSVYARASAASAIDVATAILSFSGQIYYDFGGYSLCAIGVAMTFGYAFPDNFRYPYAARGFTDFWRRWHISLSSWLRDYLYISLGGNRSRSFKTYRNLVLTMLIGGLWHGASWMFIVWGGLHGAYLVVERWLRNAVSWKISTRILDPIITISTFIAVSVAWIPFRSNSLAEAGAIVCGLIRFSSNDILEYSEVSMALFGMAATFCWHYWARDKSFEYHFSSLHWGLQSMLVGLTLVSLFLWSGGDSNAFIYFQF